MNICICYVDTAAVPYCGYRRKTRRLFLYAHWHVFDDTIRSHRLVLMLCLLLMLSLMLMFSLILMLSLMLVFSLMLMLSLILMLCLLLMLSLLLSSRDVHYINIE
jgi:hypothetical protein